LIKKGYGFIVHNYLSKFNDLDNEIAKLLIEDGGGAYG
jgi:hypothetical protein